MALFIKKYKSLILTSLIFHIFALIFSLGHLHPDEHYQILEYLGVKLGSTPVSDLSWEYGARMRPWLHPSIYFLVAKFFALFNIENHFTLTYIFRFISLSLGFTSSLFLARFCEEKFKNAKYSIYSALLLWPLPFLHARISSEAVGTSVFTFALILFFKSSKKSLILTGILFGVSFLLRYHIGFMIFGLCLHALIKKKKSIGDLSLITLTTLTIIFLSIFVGYWGYGEMTFAPLEYFKQNIIENKAANYGTSPWWYYLTATFNKLLPPIGLISLISFFYLWIKRPLSWFTFATLPFLLIHSLIGHKEWRFLFPLIPFIPICFGYHEDKIKKIPSWIIKIIIFTNLVGLLSSFKSVHPTFSFFRDTQNIEKFTNLYHNSSETPYNFARLTPHFYSSFIPRTTKIEDRELRERALSGGWFFTERGRFLNEFKTFSNCEQKYSGSSSLLELLPIKVYNKLKIFALWKCEHVK